MGNIAMQIERSQKHYKPVRRLMAKSEIDRLHDKVKFVKDRRLILCQLVDALCDNEFFPDERKQDGLKKAISAYDQIMHHNLEYYAKCGSSSAKEKLKAKANNTEKKERRVMERFQALLQNSFKKDGTLAQPDKIITKLFLLREVSDNDEIRFMTLLQYIQICVLNPIAQFNQVLRENDGKEKIGGQPRVIWEELIKYLGTVKQYWLAKHPKLAGQTHENAIKCIYNEHFLSDLKSIAEEDSDREDASINESYSDSLTRLTYPGESNSGDSETSGAAEETSPVESGF